MEHSPKKEAFKLLLVLGGSACFGLLIVISLILSYGPAGHYQANQLLIDPGQMQEFSITIDKKKLVFDTITYSYFDKIDKHLVTKALSLKAYKNLYDTISSDKSIDSSFEIQEDFDPQSSITLIVKLKNSTTDSPIKFQEMTFSNSGYYRVEHPTDPNHPWIYFFHKNLLKRLEESLSK